MKLKAKYARPVREDSIPRWKQRVSVLHARLASFKCNLDSLFAKNVPQDSFNAWKDKLNVKRA
jgi:hypothetical protein